MGGKSLTVLGHIGWKVRCVGRGGAIEQVSEPSSAVVSVGAGRNKRGHNYALVAFCDIYFDFCEMLDELSTGPPIFR
ncbi:hypothetical protein DCC26_05545 [Auritidibacter sp. NML120779]|nr:hypothetical protein DCC26_05545 [Auritidibacter sp. NML120779]